MIIDFNQYLKNHSKPIKSPHFLAQRKSAPLVVQPYLQDIAYPIVRHDLIGHAIYKNAPQDVIDLLSQLEGLIYDSPSDVARELQSML